MAAISQALQNMEEVGLTAAGYFFERWDAYSRRYRVSTTERIARPLRRLSRSFAPLWSAMSAFAANADKYMNRAAWNFTWATLSMMGVLWNFQWMLSTFIDPLKQTSQGLMNFSDAAFEVATWLAYASAMGMDFAEKLGGTDVAVRDVVEAGMFLQATLAGISAMLMVALARALKVPGVMDAIEDAIEAWIDVLTDPEIIRAIADIIKGMAEMAVVIIPQIRDSLPLIKMLIQKFLDAIPTLLWILSIITGMTPGLKNLSKHISTINNTISTAQSTWEQLGMTLGFLKVGFILLQPAMLPLMFIFSMLTAVIVQVMIWARALKGVWSLLSGVAGRLGMSVSQLLGRLLGLAGGIFFVVTAISDMIQHGITLQNVITALIGVGWILASIFGGPVAWAIMAVVTAVKLVIDYFGWWDEITQALQSTFQGFLEVLQSVYDWISKLIGPLYSVASLFGLGGGGPTTMTIYQTVSIGTIRETADKDEVIRGLARESYKALWGGY